MSIQTGFAMSALDGAKLIYVDIQTNPYLLEIESNDVDTYIFDTFELFFPSIIYSSLIDAVLKVAHFQIYYLLTETSAPSSFI